ncbi:DUF3034 family protein [Curvibacter sp. RS43]|uniref:DUF3034 family protein n=1 Tax=Curvibacter microcysteis TaxID=3026419 RepID=UPI0023616639|nr:DUF3034 family protein [Curvibacter sp. RS43]MDD0810677.1 DUF3034 family protein [Curvibacter sp. RS43]
MLTSFRLLALSCVLAAPSFSAWSDTGKLRLTGGISSVDGAGGGGVSPWALIGTQATEGEQGLSLSASRLRTQDYGLDTVAAAWSWNDRLELSLARQDFDASPAVALNGLGFAVSPGQHIRMDVLGVKWRVAGEAVLDSDSLMPQVAVGAQFKHTDAGSLRPVLDFVGAKTQGVDVYVAASKLLLERGLLLNATLRYTNANQGGLLGFGAAAPGRQARSLQPELSLAYLLRKDLAVGAEIRWNPNNLEAVGRAAGLGNALRQDAWRDLFVVWSPARQWTLTAAYVDLGRVVPGVTQNRRQSGLFVASTWSF